MGGARRVSLKLPPYLEEPSRERAQQGSVFRLPPQATNRLHQLCSVQELRLGRVVGRGGTSRVRWTERTGTQEKYATKVFNTLHPEHCKLLSAELRVLLAVDCPCVVKCFGAWTDENYINLALEAMFLGSLFDVIYVKRNPCFSCPPGVLRWRNRCEGGDNQQHGQRDERAVLAMAFQILWGLKYLHSKGIAHRDVKPSNVLADTSGSVKLADFGTALFLKEKTNDVMGTFRYMPPESAPRKAGDVWAAGLVVAEVFARDLPFRACDSHVELAQLLDESDDDTILEHVLPKKARAPESITRLVRKCLTFNPDSRPSAAELLQSDTFAGIGLRTPEQACKAVREWLYHEDNEPPRVGGVNPALQEHRRVAAAAVARTTLRADDREKYGSGEFTSRRDFDSQNASGSSSSFSNGNGGVGGKEQRGVLRGWTATSHGNRGNSYGNYDNNSEQAARRSLESHSERSSEWSSGRSLELSSGESFDLSPTSGRES